MPTARTLWRDYKLRWNRRALLLRSWRKRHQLRPDVDRSKSIRNTDILAFLCVRDEANRIGHTLQYYRDLGVNHFLVVDNGSSDGTTDILRHAQDVSVWTTQDSYKSSRFGMDWLGWLHQRFGHGHWCLTIDADELLVYPFHPERSLRDLTRHLDQIGQIALGATMLDLYPKGRLGSHPLPASGDPLAVLTWFDAWGYWARRQPKLGNLWVQGGVRARFFFASERDRAPTLNKIPLVRWNRRFTYVSSMHTMLPRRLNQTYDQPDLCRITGVLLHTKFLDSIVSRSAEEKQRQEHFANSDLYDAYYDGLSADPVLWSEADSTRYEGWHQLESLGLLSRGDWK